MFYSYGYAVNGGPRRRAVLVNTLLKEIYYSMSEYIGCGRVLHVQRLDSAIQEVGPTVSEV